jgi:hypothetical protein
MRIIPSADPCCTGNPSPTRPWTHPQGRTWCITLPGGTPFWCLPGIAKDTTAAQCRLNFWGLSTMSAMRVKGPSRWCGSCGIPCWWRCLRRISGVGDWNFWTRQSIFFENSFTWEITSDIEPSQILRQDRSGDASNSPVIHIIMKS